MKNLIIAAATTSLLAMGAAQAATVSFTEGDRPTVPGSTHIGGDAAQTPPGFDLSQDFGDNSLDNGDTVELYGRIVGALDNYSFTAGDTFSFGLLAPAGIENERGQTPNTLVFTFTNQTTMEVFEFTASTNTAPGQLGLLSAGQYILEIDMDPDNGTARYDVELSGVPIPAAAPLFAAGLAGLGIARRRRRQG
jgi:hypothetical protein